MASSGNTGLIGSSLPKVLISFFCCLWEWQHHLSAVVIAQWLSRSAEGRNEEWKKAKANEKGKLKTRELRGRVEKKGKKKKKIIKKTKSFLMLGGLFALLQTFDTSFNALCGHLLGWALPVWAMPWRMCVRENARRIKAHRDTKVIRLLKASDAMVFEWALHFGVYIFVFAFFFFFFF